MVNAFSFCLYGPENPLYYLGMLENIYLAGTYFPTWKVYVYYAPDVTESMIARMSACTNVVLRPTGTLGAKNMIHRFFAIDEPGVELMMVRDADSRIHWKDRWAIREFVLSDCIAHTIRDHVEHTALMMGGLWGLKKTAGICVKDEYANYVEDESLGARVAHDQNFLGDVLYWKVLPKLLIHYSNGRTFSGESRGAVKFPFDWSESLYCGRIETNYIDRPEPRPTVSMFLPSVSVRVYDAPGPSLPVSEQPFVPSRLPAHPLHFLRKK